MSRTSHIRFMACLLALHAGLLAWLAARHSPTIHEMAHLPAGICHWRFGMFELYRVNPPLPRMVAALPVLFCDAKTDWGNYQLGPFARETIPMGIRFAKANGERTVFLSMVARWACIPFCLLGGWVCYRWACELWGGAAGLMALCLWCFNPLILGHGAVVMPDVPAAALGVFAAWRFWKWLRYLPLPLPPGEGRGEGGLLDAAIGKTDGERASGGESPHPNPLPKGDGTGWSGAALAGLALGLAELCKTTLLVFFVLWPVMWLVYRRHRRLRRSGLQLITILLLAVYVINLGYAFKGSFQRLGDYRFQSRALSGQPPADPPKTGNRFGDTWIARLPVPLPRDYVQGIDCQRSDFEIGGRSYLHGQWSPRGWWYYYLLGLGIKTPLGTLAALLLVALISLRNAFFGIPRCAEDGPPGPSSYQRDGATLPLPSGEGRGEGGAHDQTTPRLRRATWRDEAFLLAPAIAILFLVSSQTGFSTHVRYAIPALPYLFIWCGKLFADQCLLCTPCRSALFSLSLRERAGVRAARANERPKLPHPRGRRLNACALRRSALFSLSLRERAGVRAARANERPKLPRPRGRRLKACSARKLLACLCILATFLESLAAYPHSLSFFNLLIGGPRHGHEWLLDSNGAWGQDLLYLRGWFDRHPEARPLRLATVGWLDPQALGINYTLPPVGPSRPIHLPLPPGEGRGEGGLHRNLSSRRALLHKPGTTDTDHAERDVLTIPQTWQDVRSLGDLGPRPGWYVIDVNFLHGADWPATWPGWRFQKIAEEEPNYEYFRLLEPIDHIGGSYLVYHVTIEEARRARRMLGMD